jgi:hypothetical protein
MFGSAVLSLTRGGSTRWPLLALSAHRFVTNGAGGGPNALRPEIAQREGMAVPPRLRKAILLHKEFPRFLISSFYSSAEKNYQEMHAWDSHPMLTNAARSMLRYKYILRSPCPRPPSRSRTVSLVIDCPHEPNSSSSRCCPDQGHLYSSFQSSDHIVSAAPTTYNAGLDIAKDE